MATSVKSAARLRIGVITPMLPVEHDRTRGRYIHETARALSSLAEVRVFFQELATPNVRLLKSRSYLDARGASTLLAHDIDVETLRYPALPGVSRALNGYTSSVVLAPRVRRFNPDVLLAYWLYPDGFAAIRVARALGIPVVVGALGSDVHRPTRLNRWFAKRVVRSADALLTVSEDMRRAMIRDFGADAGKVHAVVNGINAAVFHPRDRAACRARLGLPSASRIILYVGRFVRAKGLCELVDAFGALAASDPTLRLALVGDGVMRDELRSMLQSKGLLEKCLLPGGLEPDEVAEWMGAADLLCLPSWSEGYPNVVVEAVASGLPVVATDVGGTSEIINTNNGELVAPQDIQSLTKGLRETLARKWDATSVARSVKRSWDEVARETLAVCEACSSDRLAIESRA